MIVSAEELETVRTLFHAMTTDMRIMRADMNAFMDVLLPYFQKFEAPRAINDAAIAFTDSLRATSRSADACGKAFDALVTVETIDAPQNQCEWWKAHRGGPESNWS